MCSEIALNSHCLRFQQSLVVVQIIVITTLLQNTGKPVFSRSSIYSPRNLLGFDVTRHIKSFDCSAERRRSIIHLFIPDSRSGDNSFEERYSATMCNPTALAPLEKPVSITRIIIDNQSVRCSNIGLSPVSNSSTCSTYVTVEYAKFLFVINLKKMRTSHVQ